MHWLINLTITDTIHACWAS